MYWELKKQVRNAEMREREKKQGKEKENQRERERIESIRNEKLNYDFLTE